VEWATDEVVFKRRPDALRKRWGEEKFKKWLIHDKEYGIRQAGREIFERLV
jgi:hypothetical protein